MTDKRLFDDKAFSDALIGSIPGIFYVFEEGQRLIRWNKSFEAVSGYTPEELPGMQPLDFIPEDDKEKTLRAITLVFTQGEATVESSFLAKDGARTPFYFTGKLLSSAGNNYLIGLGIDISKRIQSEERLRESEEKYRGVVETSPDLIFITDRESGTILNVNNSACNILGYSKEELIGTVSGARVVTSQISTYKNALAKLKQPGSYAGEYDVLKKDGSTITVEVRGAAVGKYLLAIGRDITERKKAGEELEQYHDRLEELVKSRTAELEIAKGLAEESDRLKSAFLATMSHELRTPLNSIIGFTSMIVQGMSGPLNEEQAEQLGIVQSSGRHLLNLINDVLDISRIEAGQLEISADPFDMGRSVANAIQTVQPLAAAKQLPIISEISPDVGELVSDCRRVEQILINLLNNAVKFTEQGEVRIKCYIRGGRLVTEVHDTGVGINQNDIEKLFKPFHQLDNTLSRHYEGTGLGLSICKKLIDMMQGNISVESRYGEGSTFTFTLPLR